MADEATLIAHHEAGHVVAALMAANGNVGEKVTVCLVGGRGPGNVRVLLEGEHPRQAAFIYYAGPWSEARVLWRQPTLMSLDDTDGGMPFRRLVDAAFRGSGWGEGSDYVEYQRHMVGAQGDGCSDAIWSIELESAWPAIVALADVLRKGLENAVPEEHPYAELPGNENGTMRRFELSGPAVVALVRPILEGRSRWCYLR